MLFRSMASFCRICASRYSRLLDSEGCAVSSSFASPVPELISRMQDTQAETQSEGTAGPRLLRLARLNRPAPHYGETRKGAGMDWRKTYLGAFRGFRPSTTQMCPLALHRAHVFSFGGKWHFIYAAARRNQRQIPRVQPVSTRQTKLHALWQWRTLSFLQCVHAPGLWPPVQARSPFAT